MQRITTLSWPLLYLIWCRFFFGIKNILVTWLRDFNYLISKKGNYIPSDAHFAWHPGYIDHMIYACFLIEKNEKYSKKHGAFHILYCNTGPPNCSRQCPEPITMHIAIETMPQHACSPSGMQHVCNALRALPCSFAYVGLAVHRIKLD